MKSFLIVFFLCLSLSSFSQNGTWYKGDLHSHSTHSDGTSSVYDVINNAENKGFTFYVLTDHDNIYTPTAGVLPHWSDTAYHSNKMILMYGVEWTTDNGHACIWNNDPFQYDSIFLANTLNNPSLASKIVESQNGLFSINHSLNQALLWQYDYDFKFNCIEILNGPISYLLSNNDNVITDVWEPLLLAGRRITAVGGSDMHHLNDWMTMFYPNLGSPTTYVFSQQHNSDGILDGIRKGHVCVSNSPSEPHLEFFADLSQNDSFDFMMGDQINDTNAIVKFKVNLIDAIGDYTFRVIKNGIQLYSEAMPISTSAPSVVFSDIPTQRSYYRIELLSNNKPVAWTNPIYFGYEQLSPTVGVYHSSNIVQTDIFPNPTSNFVYIRNGTKEALNINILNIYGELVMFKSSNDEVIMLDLQMMDKGIYLLKIKNKKIDKTLKVIKQ